MHICILVSLSLYMYLYIYIYREREIDRERERGTYIYIYIYIYYRRRGLVRSGDGDRGPGDELRVGVCGGRNITYATKIYTPPPINMFSV